MSNFRSGGQPQGPVGSGIDCFLMQDNTIMAYSTDLNISEDYMLDGIQTLGYYGFRELLSLGYDCNFTMGTFLLRGADVSGNVSLPGWQPDGNNNINSSGLYTFTGLDVHTLTVLFTIMGAKYGGGDLTVAQGALMNRQTRWRARMLLPGLDVS
jgi:hypothetical protein